MYCRHCGKELEEKTKICPFCGGTQKKSAKDFKAFAPIAAAVAVIIAIMILVFNLLFMGDYKDPVDNMIKAVEKCDGKSLYKAMPEFMIEYQYDDTKRKDIYNDLENTLKYIITEIEFEYGDKDIDISYKITDKEKIKKSELKELEKSIDDQYDEDVKISKGYELTLNVTFEGNKNKGNEEKRISVYKIDGEWCIINAIF